MRPLEDPQLIWDQLYELIPSEKIVAGIMGYFMRESGFKADAIAGWYLTPNTDRCGKFVKEINKGLKDKSTKDQFVKDSHNAGGYGIGQWYTEKYLEDLYDFLSENSKSIGDLEAQCKFTVESMKANEKLWKLLEEAKTAEQCAKWIGIYYDGASEAGIAVMEEYAKEFYRDLA